jgi:DNA-binding CsgD family transcriptional regulator
LSRFARGNTIGVGLQRWNLTERQAEVVMLVGQGLTDRQIGRRLGIATGTVKAHVRGARFKLGAKNRAQASVLLTVRDGDGDGALEPPPVWRLTANEATIIEFVARGLTNRQIATELGVTEQTVKTHLSHIFGKVGALSRAHAVTLVLRGESGTFAGLTS